jgi:hypothetical protein
MGITSLESSHSGGEKIRLGYLNQVVDRSQQKICTLSDRFTVEDKDLAMIGHRSTCFATNVGSCRACPRVEVDPSHVMGIFFVLIVVHEAKQNLISTSTGSDIEEVHIRTDEADELMAEASSSSAPV